MGNAVTIEPRFEWREEPDAYVLSVLLPGFIENQIAVGVTSDARSIHIEGRGNIDAKKATYNVVNKDFDVPQNCQPNELRTRFENGVLTLILPKKITSQPAARLTLPTPQQLLSPPTAQEPSPPTPGGDIASQKTIPGEEDREKKQSDEIRAPSDVPRQKEADKWTPEKGQEEATSKPPGDGSSNETEEAVSKVKSPEAGDGTLTKTVQPDSAMDHVPRVGEETTSKPTSVDGPSKQAEEDASKVKSSEARDGTPAKIIQPDSVMDHVPRVDEEITSKAPSGDGPSSQTEEDTSKVKSPEARDGAPAKIVLPDSVTDHVPRIHEEATSKPSSADGLRNQTEEDESMVKSLEASDGTPAKIVQPDSVMDTRVAEETASKSPSGDGPGNQTEEDASQVKSPEARDGTPAKIVQPDSSTNEGAGGTGLIKDRPSTVIVSTAFAVIMALGAYLSYQFVRSKRK